MKALKSNLPSTGIGYNAGVSVGYKHAFGKSRGMKYYIEYDYSESYGSKKNATMEVKADIKHTLLTLNVDWYENPTDLFGFYIGLGVGYQDFKPSWKPKMGGNSIGTIGGSKKGGIALPINVGVSFNINPNNQITLGAKIPLIAYDYKTTLPQGLNGNGGANGNVAANVKLRTYLVQIGYNYTF